jgi:geranylgeranyl pyrophosphate synthase
MTDAGPDTASGAELFPIIFADLAEVEARLRRNVHSRLPVVPEVYLHTVHAGGKRVRPALALLCGRLAGAAGEATFDVAVAVELIHLASLIHDDVIDDGGRRRARLTANRVWGNKNAVLVADFTHAVAYRLLAQRCPMGVVARLSDTVVRMCEGELAQMFNEGSTEVSEPLYYEMIGDKTASLMAVAAELGALVSGGDEAPVAACRAYGQSLGVAFQIVDDLLDLTGDEERIGKPVGNDVRCGRLTLPLIHGLHAGGAGAERVRALITKPDVTLDDLAALRAALADTGSLAYTADAARRFADAACAELAGFPDEEPRQALEALAAYVVARTQ